MMRIKIVIPQFLLIFFLAFSLTSVIAGPQKKPSLSTKAILNSDENIEPSVDTEPEKIMQKSLVSTYKIGPGDMLNISVWKESDMNKDLRIRPDGGISFPLVGDIQVGGFTAEELTDLLTEKLKRYIPYPNVTVIVLESNSNKIYVIGKVNKPGNYAATSYMDVLQALTMAGGLTAFADGDEIKIIRRTAAGTDVKLFDYDDVISGERMELNIILKSGDTIVVP